MENLLGIFIFSVAGAISLIALASQTNKKPNTDGDRITPDWIESIEVIDGDTFSLMVKNAPSEFLRSISLRLAEIDCAELRDNEVAYRMLAIAAKNRAENLISNAKKIEIKFLKASGGFGRKSGHIIIDGRDLGQLLIAEHLAIKSNGTSRPDWGRKAELPMQTEGNYK